jgi:hypothetical protein
MRTVGLDIDTFEVLFDEDGLSPGDILPRTDTHLQAFNGWKQRENLTIVFMRKKSPQWRLEEIKGHTKIIGPDDLVKLFLEKAIEPCEAERLTDILNSLQEAADGPG